MFRDFDQSTLNDTLSVASTIHNKQYYKKTKYTGIYRQYDQITGELVQQGQFNNGNQVGLWKIIDQDGDQQHFQFRQERVGAVCGDGSYSSATGRGACSWHGGVANWLYDYVKYPAGGTGKYLPLSTRIQQSKYRLNTQMNININKSDNQLFYDVMVKLLKINKEKQQITTNQNKKIQQLTLKHVFQMNGLNQKLSQLEQQNLKLKKQIDSQKKQYEQLKTKKKQKSFNDSKSREQKTQKKKLQKQKQKQQQRKKQQQMKMKLQLLQQQINVLNETLINKSNQSKEQSSDQQSEYSSVQNSSNNQSLNKSFLNNLDESSIHEQNQQKSRQYSLEQSFKNNSFRKTQKKVQKQIKYPSLSENPQKSMKKQSSKSTTQQQKPFKKKQQKPNNKNNKKGKYSFQANKQSQDQKDWESIHTDSDSQQQNEQIFKSIPYKI